MMARPVGTIFVRDGYMRTSGNIFLGLPPDDIPANARILVSRNKREGWYVGWRVLGPTDRHRRYPSGHQREGSMLMVRTLRETSHLNRAMARGQLT